MATAENRPSMLPIDEDAVVWNVAPDDLPDTVSRLPLVVVMHGFGSDEQDLLPLCAGLGPAVLTASLRAPLPAGSGYAWFPLASLAEATTPDPAIADAAVAGLMRWLEGVHAPARTCGPVGLLGFSQGGAMVTHLLRHYPETFRCGVVLSGFTIQHQVAGDEPLAQIRPPIYWGRGDADPVVDAAAITRTRTFLSGHAEFTERTFAGLGHGVCAQEAQQATEFLLTQLTRPTRSR